MLLCSNDIIFFIHFHSFFLGGEGVYDLTFGMCFTSPGSHDASSFENFLLGYEDVEQ
jgi:hypothetical protein